MARWSLRSVATWTRRRKVVTACALAGLLGASAAVAPTARHEFALARECFRVQAQVRDRGAVVHVAGNAPTVFVLGDSYASGDQLADYRLAWPFAFARDTGLRTDVAGIGLTGFLSGGFCKKDQYGTRIAEILAARPGVLIVQSGVSDSEYTSPQIEAATRSFLRQVHSIPTVIVIGVLHVPNREDEQRIDAAVRRATLQEHRPFVPTTKWRVQLGDDGVHPTAAGAAAYARQVSAALESRLAR